MTDPADHPGMNTGGRPLSRTQQLVEVLFFLLVALPLVGVGFSLLLPAGSGFVGIAVTTILQDLSLLGIVLFLLRRRGATAHVIGWRAPSPGREIALGVLLFIPLFFFLGILQNALEQAGLSAPESPPAILVPHGGFEVALAVVFLFVVAIVEESVFRGYLILRISGIAGRPIAGILLSSIIFGVGHGYEGSAGMVAVTFVGIFFAVVYCWRQSLVAPIVMHILQNGVSLLLLPQVAPH